MNKIIDICEFHAKSKIKAGEGMLNGKYPFYTSSKILNKYLNSYEIKKEGIILGTGGNASIHYCSGKFSTSTDCLVMYSKSKEIDNEYLYYYLLNSIHILENGFKGAGLKHISKKYIEDIEINYIPDIGIQKKIINAINLSKDLINNRKEQIKILDELVKSKFVEMFGNPVTNPKGWNKEKLSDLGELARGKSKHRPRNAPELLNGPYPLIQTGDIANAGIYLKEYTQTYSELGLKQSKMWNKGTLCITIAANIAKTSILTFDACFPDSVVAFIPNVKTNNMFIQFWMSFLQKILEDSAPESAQKNINLKILSEQMVIVPPIELQNEFADFVNQVDKLKFEMEKGLKELEDNFNSLMQIAFKGELF